ncbi:MAG: hypothetical protein ABL903_18860 [Methylococcales bacterium]
MKNIRLISRVVFCLQVNVAQADLTSDAESIFNWAEKIYPHYFPTQTTTQSLDVWRYRHYPEMGIYAGVNSSDGNVYVLGGEFGAAILKVGTAQELLGMTNNPTNNSECVTVALPTNGTRTFD